MAQSDSEIKTTLEASLPVSEQTAVSYHVCDFIVTEMGIEILEFGNALFNSSFVGRYEHNYIYPPALIMEHAKSIGTLETTLCPIRDDLHNRARMRCFDEYVGDEPPAKTSISLPPLRQVIKLEAGKFGHFAAEYLQELRNDASIRTIDTATDLLFLLDRDKRILNTVCTLKGIQNLQPRTWYYNCQSSTQRPVLPDDISHVIIKPSNGTLAEGVMLVPVDELDLVLRAIQHRDVKELDELTQKLGYDKYKSRIQYYFDDKAHQNILIQEFCLAESVTRDSKVYRPTARAVFSLETTSQTVKINILDLYWQLPIDAIVDETPGLTADNVISAKGYQRPTFNCWPSIAEKEGVKQITENIQQALVLLAAKTHNYSIKDYIKDLYLLKQTEDIRYYLSLYGHIKVDHLDKDFIEMIIITDQNLAILFLIEQAKTFALPAHLTFPDRFLQKWILENLNSNLFSKEQVADLKLFMQEQRKSAKSLSYRQFNLLVIQAADAHLTADLSGNPSSSEIKSVKKTLVLSDSDPLIFSKRKNSFSELSDPSELSDGIVKRAQVEPVPETEDIPSTAVPSHFSPS